MICPDEIKLPFDGGNLRMIEPRLPRTEPVHALSRLDVIDREFDRTPVRAQPTVTWLYGGVGDLHMVDLYVRPTPRQLDKMIAAQRAGRDWRFAL